MSWDYNLLIGFNYGKSPYEFAMDAVSVAFHNPAFKGVNSIKVFKEEFIKHDEAGNISITPIEKLETREGTLDINDVTSIVSKAQLDDLLIQMVIVVPRYSRTGVKTNSDGFDHIDYDLGDVFQEDENVIISIFGKEFVGYPKDFSGKNDAGAIYDARQGEKYNVWRRGDDAFKNVQYVVNELAALIPCGIDSITALDKENSREAETSSLKFYRDLTKFIDDINEDLERSKYISESDVVSAAKDCEDIEFLQINQGMLIYSKLGVAGNLKHFYEILRSKIAK